MEDKQSVRVTILSRAYTLRVAGDPREIEAVASSVNDLMLSIAGKVGDADSTRIAVLISSADNASSGCAEAAAAPMVTSDRNAASRSARPNAALTRDHHSIVVPTVLAITARRSWARCSSTERPSAAVLAVVIAISSQRMLPVRF